MNSPRSAAPESASSLFQSHPRSFRSNRYVYPVISRRSGGVSVGVNLNLDKICNFDCVYCQVDRSVAPPKSSIELPVLRAELEQTLEWVTGGRLFEIEPFCDSPPALRRLNDIALSGDGEPTTARSFPEVVDLCVEVRRRRQLDGVRVVLITNATMFHLPRVQAALRALDADGGEIWAKLDAGTPAYYAEVARSKVPFERILANLADAARTRPIVIQSLFMKMRGQLPPEAEVAAYAMRLAEIIRGGGRIQLVQVHTVARQPAESWAQPLSLEELEAIGRLVREQTGLTVATYR